VLFVVKIHNNNIDKEIIFITVNMMKMIKANKRHTDFLYSIKNNTNNRLLILIAEFNNSNSNMKNKRKI